MRPHELANLRHQQSEIEGILFPYTPAGRRYMRKTIALWLGIIALAVVGPVSVYYGYQFGSTFHIGVDQD